MPLAEVHHWRCTAGDNWGTVAAAVGVSRADLAAANGATIVKNTVSPPLTPGLVIVIPFGT